MGMQNIWEKWSAFFLVVTIGLVFSKATSAQEKTFKGNNYIITFEKGWDTLGNASVLRKNGGFSGLATLGATPGLNFPNIDSLAVSFSDSLGGKISKDSSGIKAIGGYQVHWQKFTYDSLPKLSAQISKETNFPVTLKNGSFRVYYLNSEGINFSIACISILYSGVTPGPYADIERAIATLKVGSGSRIIFVALAGAQIVWVRDGKLGGSWLQSNKVFAVECFDMRGTLIGTATHAAEGTWELPKIRKKMFVRLRTAIGTGLHLIVHP